MHWFFLMTKLKLNFYVLFQMIVQSVILKNKMGGIHHISFTIDNYEKNKKALKRIKK